jgi:hypothetical protein
VPKSARYWETTVVVAPGQTRDVIIEDAVAGDWAFHCHKRHHPMNAMGHAIPNMIGVDQSGLQERIQELVPGYMAMGETGMHEHAEHGQHMDMPENTIPMMGGDGPFGTLGMGGMFTVFKVRDKLSSYSNAEAGWFKNPPGTVAYPVGGTTRVEPKPAQPAPQDHSEHNKEQTLYTCPMHPEVISDKPGQCPKCGMDLVPKKPSRAPLEPEDPHQGH